MKSINVLVVSEIDECVFSAISEINAFFKMSKLSVNFI